MSPEEEFAALEASSGFNGTGPPGDIRDVLPCDDHATIAKELAKDLDGAIFADERFYRYQPEDGRWREVGDREIGRILQGYSRRPYFDAAGKTKELKIDSHDVKGATELARALLDRPGFFDSAPRGVAFANGFVVVQDGASVLLPHSPDNRVRHAHQFAFNPAAPRAELDEFLDQLFADVGEDERAARIMLLQEFAGAALFGLAPAYQKCLVMVGKGGQGKSETLEIVRAVFPSKDAIASLPPHMWGEQFAIEQLAGKLANMVDEIPETEIVAGATFKGIITGDPVSAERKYQPKFTFCPVAAHIFSCNHLPTTADLSEAFFDRFVLLLLSRKMRGSDGARPEAARHVISSCLPGIVAWAVEGAVRLVQQGKYTIPVASVSLLSSWKQDCDNVAIFAADRCRPANLHVRLGPGNGTRAAALYAIYREWSASSGFRPVSIKTFANRLDNQGIDKERKEDGLYYALMTGAAPTSDSD